MTTHADDLVRHRRERMRVAVEQRNRTYRLLPVVLLTTVPVGVLWVAIRANRHRIAGQHPPEGADDEAGW